MRVCVYLSGPELLKLFMLMNLQVLATAFQFLTYMILAIDILPMKGALVKKHITSYC